MDLEQRGRGPADETDGGGIELVYRQVQQTSAIPETTDYSPTLGAIAQELRAVGKRLDGMEAHPALRLTPAAYAQ